MKRFVELKNNIVAVIDYSMNHKNRTGKPDAAVEPGFVVLYPFIHSICFMETSYENQSFSILGADFHLLQKQVDEILDLQEKIAVEEVEW